MAKFLKTADIRSALDGIIREADKQVTLISPFIRISVPLFQTLKIADSRKVRIRLVYGKKKELDSDVRSQLEQLDNLSLAFLQNLHAKCFFNEKQALVTSLNLYDFSEQNVEMGILINAKDEVALFRDVTKEAEDVCTKLADKVQLRSSVFGEAVKGFKSRVDAAVKDEPKRPKSRSYSHKPRTKQPGHCIRCGKPIPLDLDKPLCRNCFEEWAEWENPNWVERYCHTCGKSARTTIAMPECNTCYNESQK